MPTKKAIRDSIRRIESWYSGKCPPDILADELRCSVEDAIKILTEYKPSAVNDKKPVSKPVPKKVTKPVEELGHSDLLYKGAKKFLPYGSAIIAMIALARSFMFTYSYFYRTDSVLSAIFMALLFGLVGYLSPSICILAYKAKRYVVLSIAFILFVLFGWLNTYITVQELDVSKDNKEVVVSVEEEMVLKARDRVTAIDVELVNIESGIVRANAEYNSVLAKSNEPDLKSWEYNRHRTNLANVKESITKYENDRTTLNNEKKELTSLAGYYTMDVTTKEDKQSVRSMDMVYAISLEVVGPIFLVFALFL